MAAQHAAMIARLHWLHGSQAPVAAGVVGGRRQRGNAAGRVLPFNARPLPPAPAETLASRGRRMKPALLAFDTSTERLAIALQAPSGVWLADEPGGALASATLLPRITAMLARAGVSGSEVGHVAFGSGPGAFTGLRTSAAVAQGLALGWGVPVLAIDSLLIVAEDARGQCAAAPGRTQRDDAGAPFDVAVVMDARMNQVYAALYRWSQGRWSVLDAPRLFDLAALAVGWPGRPLACIAGSALAAFGERLVLPVAPRVPSEQQRSAALLRLAQTGWRDGHAVDAALGLPSYVRDKVALTTREREAGA
jgi:tRNA threonylcarbamoyladenosine biosynthesis protein TsaB